MIIDFLDTITTIKKLYTVSLEPVCKQYNLTRMELDILLFLANNPQYDSAKDIIKHRKLTKSHVSTSIKSLTKNNYLKPVYLPNNKKTVHLKLLNSADEIIKAGQQAQKNFFETILKDFSKDEKLLIINAFSKIQRNAQQKLKED
ncbi:MarR family transcriptional regulator [Thomasclavelia saccharogumia]|uniref:MarR family transcriptional regulator n=1 Tax=Thomasclavelia saccharogumia TaxID=341225 RepID=UPI00069137FC|nr:MarR family transcriptional regulator [Thomasclavelia saccharogumia]